MVPPRFLSYQISLFFLIYLPLFVYSTQGTPNSSPTYNETEKILDFIQTHSSEWKRIRPNSTSPTLIKVSVKIPHIPKIDLSSGVLNLQFYFRQYWNDPRLAFDTYPEVQRETKMRMVNLKNEQSDLVWKPDLYFGNELIGLYTLNKPNVNLRLFGTGDIIYSQRLHMELSCPEIWKNDSFSCGSNIGSYGMMTDELVVAWQDGNSLEAFGVDKVFPYYKYKGAEAKKGGDNSFEDVAGMESYSCVNFQLKFSKDLGHFWEHALKNGQKSTKMNGIGFILSAVVLYSLF